MQASAPMQPMRESSVGSLTSWVNKARWRDGAFLRRVRNHPQVIKQSGTRPVGMMEHWLWWLRVLLLRSEVVWIGRIACKRAGYIRVRKGLHCWIVSLAVLPPYQRAGLGLFMLEVVDDERKRTEPDTTVVWAEVEVANTASCKLFERAGFRLARPIVLLPLQATEHTVWYRK